MDRSNSLQTAQTFMTSPVITVNADDPIVEATRTLIRKKISGAPVIDDEGEVIGVLSEQDCMRILATEAFHAMPAGTVRNHMTGDVETIDVSSDLFHTVFLLNGRAYKRLPVMDKGRLVGIVTRRDVIRALEKLTKKRKALPRKANYDEIAEQG